MKSSSSRRSRRFSSISNTSTTVTTVLYNEHSVPNPVATEIPITSCPDTEGSSSKKSVPVTVHLKPQPRSSEYSAAVKIQSVYRSHVVRVLVRKIASVNSEANYWQRIIQRQETVDAVRSSDLERIKVNEALMALLLKLDSVPGFNPNVRELRRHVSRKIVGLQEILDAVTDTRAQHWDAYLNGWDDIIAGMEKEVCNDRGGGHEMEKFCAEHLGFQCLQRFLRDQ